MLAPAETKVREFIDKQQMEGLERFARGIGAKLSRVMTGAPGYQVPGKPSPFTPGRPGEIVTRFGTPEEVLAHEIGHEIDGQYPRLRQALRANPAAWSELERLADLRASGQVSQTYQNYLRSQPERVANLVAALVHAPELLKNVAPNAHAILDNFLTSTPRLQDLLSVKPSLELSRRDQMMRLAGPMLTGHYYMPDAAARLFENHMSPGLGGSRAYRVFRGIGNQMTQFILGASAYHATATTLNAQFSALAEAMHMATRGDFLQAASKAPEALIPGYAAFQAVRRAMPIRAEWDRPGSQSPEVQQQVQWLKEMGGRARGGQDYMGSQLEAFQSASRQVIAGKYGKAPEALLRALPALNHLLSKPTMDYLVPLIKVGVAVDAMRYEMMKNPGMDLIARREVGGKIWDAMDDRFGLLTYDNLFIPRAAKDALQTAFLSFGWNLGDVRGLGGGIADAFKPSQWAGLARGEGVSRRTGFLLSMMVGTGVYGALYQLLATGKPPQETKDLWFPRNGQTLPDGTPMRVSIPGYMKDLASVTNRAGQSPLQIPRNLYGMAKGKISPAVNLVADLLGNEDWRGAAIDNPADPWQRQVKDDALHILRAFVPISAEMAYEQHKRGASLPQQLQGFVGINPAPYRITHSDEELLREEQRRRYLPSPWEKKRRDEAKK